MRNSDEGRALFRDMRRRVTTQNTVQEVLAKRAEQETKAQPADNEIATTNAQGTATDNEIGTTTVQSTAVDTTVASVAVPEIAPPSTKTQEAVLSAQPVPASSDLADILSDEGLFGKQGKTDSVGEIIVPQEEEEVEPDQFILFTAKPPVRVKSSKRRIAKILEMTYDESPNVELEELGKVDQPLEDLIKQVLDDQ